MQQRGGHARLHRDPRDPDVVDALARDQLDGGVEDPRARAGGHGAQRYLEAQMTPGERARAFVDEILIPREVDAELGAADRRRTSR